MYRRFNETNTPDWNLLHIKNWAMTVSRALRRAVMDEKSLSPL